MQVQVKFVCLLTDSFSAEMSTRKATLSNQSLSKHLVIPYEVVMRMISKYTRPIFTKYGHYSRVTYTSRDTLLDFLIVSQS